MNKEALRNSVLIAFGIRMGVVPGRAATIAEVALHVGASRQAVSKVLHDLADQGTIVRKNRWNGTKLRYVFTIREAQ